MTRPELEGNPIFRSFLEGRPIALEAPLGFACRGCGQHCCVDKDIFLTPPEAARIMWFLRRNPALDARLRDHGIDWGELFVGESSGLPTVRIRGLPFDRRDPGRGTYCPFLSPVYRDDGGAARWAGMAWCGIHTARPGACRIFPLGRIAVDAPGQPGESSYALIARCPGFEHPNPGDPLPPGYAPAAPGQTAGDWLREQSQPAHEQERICYLHEVVPALLADGLHASAELNPGGHLSDEEAIGLGHAVLYAPPDPPAQTDDDHVALMAWLRELPTRARYYRATIGR